MKFNICHYLDPAFERKLDFVLNALLTQGEKIMSAISDFAAKQNAYNNDVSARLDAIQTEITALNTQITTLQNSPGQISAADQATLDGLVTTGASLQAKADALVNLPNPPTPPAS